MTETQRPWVGPALMLALAIAAGVVLRPRDPETKRLPVGPLPPAPWALKDPSGRTRRSEEWSGRWVVLAFWATYCPPCRREVPMLNELHARPGRPPMSLVAIACDPEPTSVVPDFLRHENVSYPVVYATPEMLEAYGVVSLPQTFVIDPRGRVAARFLGRLRRSDLEAVLKESESRESGAETEPKPGSDAVRQSRP